MKRFLLSIVALAIGLAATGRAAAAQGYVVVVNASGPAALSKAEVSNIFLKKSSKLTPVDLEKSSKVRDAFSKGVHGRPAAAVGTYWQQQIFAGKEVPPPEKGSDADVIAFVKGNPNAIGYVAAGTELGAGVKPVTVQ